MFLSALQPYVVIILIAVIILQYAFAVFCLLKLAYLDIDKKFYILWNLFILIIFFIGGAVFLWYYYKHPELRVSKAPSVSEPLPDSQEEARDGKDTAQSSDDENMNNDIREQSNNENSADSEDKSE